MEAMPRPLPTHLHLETTRHGTRVWYVRIGHGPRTRIRAAYDTPEFLEEYRAAVEQQPREPVSAGERSGSLSWLIERYRATAVWAALSPATRRQRENIFLQVRASAGDEPFARITQATIVRGRDRRSQTPAQARNFLDAMRGLFRWAHAAGHVKTDPTAGVKNPPRPKTDGFAAWNEDDVAAYERRWPLGTRQRVWLDVLLYTGLRRGDAVRLGRQHVREIRQDDGSIVRVAEIKTEKGGVPVTLPILTVLQQTIAAGPCGDLAFICGEAGGTLTKESFGNEFSAAARAAGIRKSAHGVRKIAATTAANRGATEAQLEAIFGWRGGAMASLYTRAANRRRLAIEAMHLLANNDRTSPPAPHVQVRDSSRKET